MALKRVKDTVSKFLSETVKKFKAGEVKLSQVVWKIETVYVTIVVCLSIYGEGFWEFVLLFESQHVGIGSFYKS